MSLIDEIKAARAAQETQDALAARAAAGTHAMYERLRVELATQVDAYKGEMKDPDIRRHIVIGDGFRVERERTPAFRLKVKDEAGQIDVTMSLWERHDMQPEVTQFSIPIHAGHGQGEFYYLLDGKRFSDASEVATILLRPVLYFANSISA